MKNIVTATLLLSLASVSPVLSPMASAYASEKEKHDHGHHGHAHQEHKAELAQKAEHAHSEEKAKASQQSHAAHAHDHGHAQNHTQEGSSSPFYGHLDIAIHADSILSAGEPDEEINEFYTHSHLEMGARLGHGLSINTNIKLEGEPSGHDHGGGGGAANGRDRFFKAHPLLIEQLTVNYDDEVFSLYAGKFNPIIGFDYHSFGGLFTYQTIEEYAVRERIGFGGALKHDAGDLGKHRLDASTFFADTTFLSNSVLYERGRTRKSSGGLSNTEDFNSFAVSLGGRDIALSPRGDAVMSYRFGYAKQAAGIGNERDEKRYSASLGFKTHLTEDLVANLVAEHVQVNHLGGEADHDRSTSTAALRLDYMQWNIAAAYTHLHNDAGDPDEGAEGNIFQISAGYLFESGIGVGIGYQRADEENEVTKKIGGLVSYSMEF